MVLSHQNEPESAPLFYFFFLFLDAGSRLYLTFFKAMVLSEPESAPSFYFFFLFLDAGSRLYLTFFKAIVLTHQDEHESLGGSAAPAGADVDPGVPGRGHGRHAGPGLHLHLSPVSYTHLTLPTRRTV